MKKLQSILSRYSLALLVAFSFAGGTSLAKAAPTDFSAAELDQMLAPIALYPDTILSHVLIAATYPLEIVQADRWVRDNPGLEAEAAVAAVEDQDWDPSVKALVAFPQILQRMSENLAWTQNLGDAFLDDEAEVMDAIQQLRNKAYAAGSLDRVEHLRVQREKEIIVIEPAAERVVYVPVYDTRVVYGNWWWDDYPPIHWHYPAHYTFVHGFYWGPRVHVGTGFYFSSFHWHRRQVVYVDYHRHHRHPHFHSGRSIVHYQGARHWRHNPVHRRGVAYRNDRIQQHFDSNRQSYRSVRQERADQVRRHDRQSVGRPHGQRNNLHESVRERLGDRPSHHLNPRRSQTETAAAVDRVNTTRPSRADPGRADPNRANTRGEDSPRVIQRGPGAEARPDNQARHPRTQLDRRTHSNTEGRVRTSGENINRDRAQRMEGVNRTSRPSTEHRANRAERSR